MDTVRGRFFVFLVSLNDYITPLIPNQEREREREKEKYSFFYWDFIGIYTSAIWWPIEISDIGKYWVTAFFESGILDRAYLVMLGLSDEVLNFVNSFLFRLLLFVFLFFLFFLSFF